MSTLEQAAKLSALLVEDEPSVQLVTKANLEDIGFTVDVVKSGEEAITLTKNKQYDIIFMDIGLPGMDGAITTYEIRKIEQRLNIKPHIVVAVTANNTEECKKHCIKMGINEVIMKPLKPEKIEEIKKRLLNEL